MPRNPKKPTQPHLNRKTTPLRTLIMRPHKIRRQHTPELRNIPPINLPRLAERNIHHPLILKEEVLRNLARAWVGGVERGDEGGGRAVVVELVVDGAHGEDGALEGVQRGGDFGC